PLFRSDPSTPPSFRLATLGSIGSAQDYAHWVRVRTPIWGRALVGRYRTKTPAFHQRTRHADPPRRTNEAECNEASGDGVEASDFFCAFPERVRSFSLFTDGYAAQWTLLSV